MKLQTKIPIESENPKIDYDSKIVLLGSCFIENIGNKLDYVKFHTLQNPFGVLFHPLAIERIIERALQGKFFSEDDIFFRNEHWHCFEIHSLIYGTNKDDYLTLINTKLNQLRTYLLTASHIVLTFGTAWVYRLLASQSIVANCFKIPQKEFEKELLTTDQILKSVINIISLINTKNLKASLLLTVSPVRHLKNGFIKNNLGKAHLIVAIQEALVRSNLPNLHYFPSYELMIDELRDYRFYKEDMIHPNNTAIDIIWESFSKAWISSDTTTTQKLIGTIQSGLSHHPFDATSKQHQLFLKDLKTKINQVEKKFPHIKF